MILKVLQPDTGKWFYYDRIHLFKTKYGKRDVGQPITEEEISLLPQGRDPELTVAICDLNFESGRTLTVVFGEEGYLLNDEGRTIEKIM